MHVPSSASVSPSMIGDTQLRSFKNAPAACRHNISLSKIDSEGRRALPNLSTNLRDKAFHCDWQIKMTSFPRGNISRPARNFRILDFSQFIKNSRIFRELYQATSTNKKIKRVVSFWLSSHPMRCNRGRSAWHLSSSSVFVYFTIWWCQPWTKNSISSAFLYASSWDGNFTTRCM